MTKFNIGDRVEVTIVGDVNNVDGEFLELSNDVHLWTKTPDIQIRKVPPPKPVVGDVIDGARLAATPWKAGTLVSDGHGVLMLTRDGEWVSYAGKRFAYLFSSFQNDENLTVVYLP